MSCYNFCGEIVSGLISILNIQLTAKAFGSVIFGYLVKRHKPSEAAETDPDNCLSSRWSFTDA